MRKMTMRYASLSLVLVALAACSGGGGNPQPPPGKSTADTLAYSNPTSTGYALMRDPASTASHLILDLVGPAAGQGHGVSLTLALSGPAAWSKVLSSDVTLAENGPFALGATVPITAVKGSGNQLQFAFFQKRTLSSPVALNQTLAKVALDLAPNTPVNTPITITAPKGAVLLADGSLVNLAQTPVAVGSLVAN